MSFPETFHEVVVRPELFALAEKPPKRVHVEGTRGGIELLDDLPAQGLAIVGTRDPQPRSIQLMRQVVRGLEGTDRIIVSGFARGVDAMAHELALDHHLPTIAILAAGTDVPYPREHQDLKKRILASGGLLISESDLGSWPQPFSFLLRNRLIAAWTQATWVVEAGVRSGALNTARWARDRHRDVFATPCFPGDPTYLGCQGLIDLHQAFPLWGTHSLGQVWLDLAARKEIREPELLMSRPALNPSLAGPDERTARFFLHCITARKGGASVAEALDWSLEQGWSPQRFFLALQHCLDLRWVREERGLLVSC